MARTIKQRIERAQKTRVRQLRARINPSKKLYKIVFNDHHCAELIQGLERDLNKRGLNAVIIGIYDPNQKEAIKVELIG